MKTDVASRFRFCVAMLLVSACQPVVQSPEQYSQPSAVRNSSLLGTWKLVSVDGIRVPANSVKVTFRSDGAFAAILDCNNARGFYELTAATLSFHGWYSTERGCDPPLQHLDIITKALQGDGYVVNLTSGSELHLTGAHQVFLRRL